MHVPISFEEWPSDLMTLQAESDTLSRSSVGVTQLSMTSVRRSLCGAGAGRASSTLQDVVYSGDEGALFEIANRFAEDTKISARSPITIPYFSTGSFGGIWQLSS